MSPVRILALSRLRNRVLLWSVIPLLVGLAFGLLSPKIASPVGCSRVDDAHELPGGCWYSPGSACYECYYSDSRGFRTCYESPDGSRSFCTDHRDTI